MELYDRIGVTYGSTRRADPRIAAVISDALGDAGSVINVGAGAGSYETERTVVAIEPSTVMIAQRPPGAAPVLRAVAEQLPLRDRSADAAMALLTVHHWSDVAAGVAELRRVVRRRLVILTWWPERLGQFWLSGYLPQAARADATMAVPVETLMGLLPGARVVPVPIPADCADGFAAAYWRRPEAYLDPLVQAGISLMARASPQELRSGLGRLADDLSARRWHRDHTDLLELDSLDVGYCLLIADVR